MVIDFSQSLAELYLGDDEARALRDLHQYRRMDVTRIRSHPIFHEAMREFMEATTYDAFDLVVDGLYRAVWDMSAMFMEPDADPKEYYLHKMKMLEFPATLAEAVLLAKRQWAVKISEVASELLPYYPSGLDLDDEYDPNDFITMRASPYWLYSFWFIIIIYSYIRDGRFDVASRHIQLANRDKVFDLWMGNYLVVLVRLIAASVPHINDAIDHIRMNRYEGSYHRDWV